MSLCFCFLLSRETNTKLPAKPNAVKIFITDCPPCVKRNSFPSADNGPQHTRESIGSRLRRFKHVLPRKSMVPHQSVRFLRHWIETVTELLPELPCFSMRLPPNPGAMEAGMTTFT